MEATVEVFVNNDCRVILQGAASQFSISKELAHLILHEKTIYEQGKCCVGAKTADRRPKGIQVDHSKRTFGACAPS